MTEIGNKTKKWHLEGLVYGTFRKFGMFLPRAFSGLVVLQGFIAHYIEKAEVLPELLGPKPLPSIRNLFRLPFTKAVTQLFISTEPIFGINNLYNACIYKY